ncbi:MAG: hypothetical protein ABR586_06885 [Thermoplasmatota archaeon]
MQETAAVLELTLQPTYRRPQVRPLKIFAVDPMQGRTAGNRVTIDLENEPLKPGPVGERIEVVDYDGAHGRFYPAVDLDHPLLLMNDGMDPTESDPRFHAQMAYAVAMRTLQNFDRALGRRLSLGSGHGRGKLRLYPHAFHGANAFFDPKLNAVLFGYFRADRQSPGQNLPGQTVFTCLSHDIIAHEVTHACVHHLRRHFLEPSNEDVPAFHEAFADLVALFQHFSYKELLREQMQRSRGDLRERSTLVDLAGQFGQATGTGRALRTAIDVPDQKRLEAASEPHERGSILVAAVFDAFFQTYGRRTDDLLRIATGGTGRLPDGALHPDLVARIAGEAARTAQQYLTMCIRAFDYLPPVDITFGDYLRALVTADRELAPDDEWGQRAALIEAFRRRGIYPAGVFSLAEESLLWEAAPATFPALELGDADTDILDEFVSAATAFSRERPAPAKPEPEPADAALRNRLKEYREKARYPTEAAGGENDPRAFYRRLHAFAMANRGLLQLHPEHTIAVDGAHTVFRVSPNGQLLIEFIVQYTQAAPDADPELGGLPLRGGTTVVASWDGTIRYVIAKPLPNPTLTQGQRAAAVARRERQKAYVARCDAADPNSAYLDAKAFGERMRLRMGLRALHDGGLA